jgi:hypothetical protein
VSGDTSLTGTLLTSSATVGRSLTVTNTMTVNGASTTGPLYTSVLITGSTIIYGALTVCGTVTTVVQVVYYLRLWSADTIRHSTALADSPDTASNI